MSEAGDLRAIAAIVEMVETYFGLPAGSIISYNRSEIYIRPRMIVMYLARVELGLTLERAAAGLNRDHSSVYHGAKVVLRSHDLWYLRDVVRGVRVFQPKHPSIEDIGARVANYFQIPVSHLRASTGSGRYRRTPARARHVMILVANQFGMVQVARTYLHMRSAHARELVSRPWPEPTLITNLFNQVRRHHGTQQEHWAVSGRRYCLSRGREERRSPIPAPE